MYHYVLIQELAARFVYLARMENWQTLGFTAQAPVVPQRRNSRSSSRCAGSSAGIQGLPRSLSRSWAIAHRRSSFLWHVSR